MSKNIIRPQPIDQCVDFKIEELFFSTTDDAGTILSGNNVFVRIAQYSEEDLIGSPHNIIRHPDMPKIVFKVLWDYIRAGRPVAAYVKNLAKDGRYYWVYATVFPIDGGYLSIRLKPTTPIFDLIPTVYKALIEKEKEGGLDDSLLLLLEIIKSKGFESYDIFFLTALIEELKSRNQLIQEKVPASNKSAQKLETFSSKKDNSNLSLFEALGTVKCDVSLISNEFSALFSQLDSFMDMPSTFNSFSMFIVNLARSISLLAINADVESHKAGVSGVALSVLAGEIKVRSDEMSLHAGAINEISKEFTKDSSQKFLEIGFQIAAPKLQIEMIMFFVNDLIKQADLGSISQENVQIITKNGLSLISLLSRYLSKTMKELEYLNEKLIGLLKVIDSIELIIRELESTQFIGVVESAKVEDSGKNFRIVFDSLTELNIKGKKELEFFNDSIEKTQSSVFSMLYFRQNIENLLDSIGPEINNLINHISISEQSLVLINK